MRSQDLLPPFIKMTYIYLITFVFLRLNIIRNSPCHPLQPMKIFLDNEDFCCYTCPVSSHEYTNIRGIKCHQEKQ